jgi:hypothetical protein
MLGEEKKKQEKKDRRLCDTGLTFAFFFFFDRVGRKGVTTLVEVAQCAYFLLRSATGISTEDKKSLGIHTHTTQHKNA